MPLLVRGKYRAQNSMPTHDEEQKNRTMELLARQASGKVYYAHFTSMSVQPSRVLVRSWVVSRQMDAAGEFEKSCTVGFMLQATLIAYQRCYAPICL